MHFFDPKDSFSNIGLLATLELACDTNRIHEGAALWVLPYYVCETLANALNCGMCETNKSSHIAPQWAMLTTDPANTCDRI